MNPIFAVAIKEFQERPAKSLAYLYHPDLCCPFIRTELLRLGRFRAARRRLPVFDHRQPIQPCGISDPAPSHCYSAMTALSGEQESGTLLLLLTYPISHVQLLIGKFLGSRRHHFTGYRPWLWQRRLVCLPSSLTLLLLSRLSAFSSSRPPCLAFVSSP